MATQHHQQQLLHLPALQPFITAFAQLVASSSPPASILIHAPANPSLVLPLLSLIFDTIAPVPANADSSAPPPTVQQLLPKLAIVDLEEVHSTRQAFDRALNQLSGWTTATGLPGAHHDEEIPWDDKVGAVINWDGRTEGLGVERRRRRRQRSEVDGASAGKRRRSGQDGERAGKRARLDGDGGSPNQDRIEETPAPENDGEEDARDDDDDDEDDSAQFEWVLTWDRTIPPVRDVVAPAHDTIDLFHTSLATIASLGSDVDHSDQEQARPAHRFLVFDHAEMLSDLASAGNIGGAPKETGMGMTFASTIARLGQLSRVPITSISISKLGALKSRDALVGLSMPTVLQFPDLNALDPKNKDKPVDTVALLTSRFASTSPTSSTLTTPQLVELFGSLASVVWEVFSKSQTGVEELAYTCAKFWPKWLECVERSNPPVHYKNTASLLSHLKPDFAREHERLGLPRQSLSLPASTPNSPTKAGPAGNVAAASTSGVLHGFVGSMPALPKPSPALDSPCIFPSTSNAPQRQPVFTPPAITPTASSSSLVNSSSNLPVASQSSSTTTSLARSLPRLARFLLLASFYAAFNPPKSDVRHFVRIDETVVKKGKKGRKVSPKKPGSPSKASRTAAETGGKPFPLERLLAIFEAIVDSVSDDVDEKRSVGTGGVDVMMQITTLLNLRLLTRQSAQDKLLDGVKLRCRVSKDTIEGLAKSLGFGGWREFLWDPEA